MVFPAIIICLFVGNSFLRVDTELVEIAVFICTSAAVDERDGFPERNKLKADFFFTDNRFRSVL